MKKKKKQIGITWHFHILCSAWPIDHLLPITGELQEILLIFLILQSLTLLFPRKREIIEVARDTEGAHASHWEWSFALDTESEQFSEEMGAQWSNVTSRLMVPAKVPLWILAILN